MEQNVSRPKIWEALQKAWRKTIREDYNKRQELSSEHHLQAAFYARLKSEIKKIGPSWKVFVEPKIKLTERSKDVVYPDIMICNTRSLICAIELKYKPRVSGPRITGLQKDIDTLLALAEDGNDIRLDHERYRGKRTENNSYESVNTLFVWAGVYASGRDVPTSKDAAFRMPVAADKASSERLHDLANCGRFASLHAITKEGESAEIAFGYFR